MKTPLTTLLLTLMMTNAYASPALYNVQDLGSAGLDYRAVALNAPGHVLAQQGTKPVAYRDGLLDLQGLFGAAPNASPATLWGLNDQDHLIGGRAGAAKLFNPSNGELFSFPASVTQLTALNNRDAVVGYGRSDGGQKVPFYYDGAYHLLSLNAGAKLNALNDAGQIAGQQQLHAMLWPRYDATAQDLGTLGGARSNALALNSLGQVTGWAEHADQSISAFYYDGHSLHDIGSFADGNSVGLAIADNGIVVGQADFQQQALREYLFYGDDLASTSAAHAFYFDGQLYDLNDYLTQHDVVLTAAKAINSQQQILAEGYDANDVRHLLLLTPVANTLTASAITATKAVKKVDLALTISASVAPAIVGQVFNAVVTVSNIGKVAANQNEITITLDSAATLVSMNSATASCSKNSNTISCSLASLPVAGKQSINLQLRPKFSGALSTSAKVLSSRTDLNTDNNSDKLLTTVINAPAPAVKPTVTPTTQNAPIPTPKQADNWYKPSIGTTWQIQLAGKINMSYDAAMYEIDLFDSSVEQIKALQTSGKKVICYFSAGSSENWRSDFSQFKATDMGKSLDGWPGEQWLDVRSDNVFNIMQARIALAKSKGCDGVDPDNVDGYSNKTGFTLTAADQLSYNKKLAAAAHVQGLAIALKNDLEQAAQLVADFDFSVNEQCFYYKECELLQTSFIAQGKPVFNIEYQNKYVTDSAARASFCATSQAAQFSSLILPLSLDDKYRYSCR